MPILLGLTGKPGSGKDTVGQFLVDQGWVRVAFADAVRELALRLDPIVTSSLVYPRDPGTHYTPGLLTRHLSAVVHEVGWERAKAYPEVRRLLQDLGTGVRDIISERAWLDIARRKMDDAFMAGKDVVLTDVRFLNEARMVDFISTNGIHTGGMVRVVRPGLVCDDTHIAENALNDYLVEFTIHNNGDLEDLRHEVEIMLECCFGL